MSSVFIIGAGASIDAGFPSGDELRAHISDSLDFKFDNSSSNPRIIKGSYEIYKAMRLHIQRSEVKPNINDFVSTARHVAHAVRIATSIDHLIETHADNERLALISKLAIAMAIKKCEASSKIIVDPGNAYNKMDFEFIDSSTWYRELFNILFLGCKVEDIEAVLDSVTFIVFNYDRCLEYVMFHMIKDYFGLEAEHAQELMLNANFYHPYGTVGSRGRAVPARNHLIDITSAPDGSSLLENARLLRTFSEGTDEESSDISKIRDSLQTADQIVSLGFAYHDINLRLLNVSGEQGKTPFFGTAMSISAPNLETIKRDMSDHLGIISIKALENQSCRDFLKDFNGPIGRIHRGSL